jgi:cell filamentation protein
MKKALQKISIRFFKDREVRAVWDDEHTKWWFSIVDIVGILNEEVEYIKAGNYWRWIKKKLLKSNIQFVSDTLLVLVCDESASSYYKPIFCHSERREESLN